MAASARKPRKRAAHTGRRRRSRMRGHFTLLILFLLAAAAVLCMTFFMKVGQVRVVGVERYDPDQIAVASGIQVEDSLLRVDTGKAEQRILDRFPYLDTVEVKIKLPPAIEIEVTQCEAESAIYQNGDVILIKREGKVLERGSILVPENVPIVKGINAFNIQPGGWLPESQAEKLGMLSLLLDAMEQTGFTSITNVDITDRLNMKVLYENRIILQLGSEAELVHKLEFVKYTLEHNLDPSDRGILDAAEAHLARQVVFRPDAAAGDLINSALMETGIENEPEIPEKGEFGNSSDQESAENIGE